jgi:NADPH:quinone reductase-like Zn-dependent oxidoreductase
MKAIAYTKYGPPDVLQLKEVEKPTPTDNQVLVRVHAVSLNPTDWHARSGMLLVRLMTGGLLRPKHTIPGADFAGRVEAVGRNVTHFQPGDEVFGRRDPGGFAEYLCVSENPIALKPANITFAQAAAVPVAAVTALQSLRDVGQIQSGQKVLVNGASGGVGTFAVQIAKLFGAEVTGVCSTRNLDLVRSIGANRVIDYTREDFTRTGQRYDLIIDNVGNRSVPDLARALRPNGICVTVGFSSIGRVLQNGLQRLIPRTGGTKFGGIMARINNKDLVLLKELIEAGKVVPVIDRCYPLREVPEAFRYAEEGRARGKVVIALDPNRET